MARVLLVNLQGVIGGAERSLLLIVKHLRSQFLISVACPPASRLSEALASIGIKCHKLPRPPRYSCLSLSYIVYCLRTSFYLTRTILKARPDIIHANSIYAWPASVLAAVATRRKLVLHARDLANFGPLAKFCSRFSKKVIAVSNAVKDALIKQGVNPDKIEVVYNGIDGTCLLPGENEKTPIAQSASEKHSFVFAHVGQLVPWKNHIAFLKAASHAAPFVPTARFVFIGDDISGRDSAYKRHLLSYVENSAIAKRISFLGWQEDMNQVWPKINCLVHTTDREPFGRVIIEAMAHKVPVIAVDACGPSEIIQNGRAGILVSAGDIEELTEAMLKVALDAQLAKKLTAAAYDCVCSDFTADRTATRVRQIYEEVLAT